MPSGWHGITQTIRAFLNEKEIQFATEHETSVSANTVSRSLKAIVRAIVDSGESTLPWSQAQRVISHAMPQAGSWDVIEWLERADLLMVDAPATNSPLSGDSLVRPAFERLGDFLLAEEALERSKHETGLDVACQPGGLIYTMFKEVVALEQNNGILSALSILVPEHNPGLELPNLVKDELIRSSLVQLTVQSFPSRNPDTFTKVSASLIREALGQRDLSARAMDAVLAVSFRPSAIDAIWLDALLKQYPLARRDAFWCCYLHDRFESAKGTVPRLIDAAFELPLEQLEPEIAERWATVLFWFTAAADRRIKDRATRAVTAVLTAHTKIIPNLMQRFLDCDDDVIRERVLLACYGALIISQDAEVVQLLTVILHDAYYHDPMMFDNAMIRDHIRCINELAQELGTLVDGGDPKITMKPIDSEWPLALPSNGEVKRWGELPKLARSCLEDDFFIYTMGCLSPWEHTMPKEEMGKWILLRVARDFGYEGSGCEKYDRYMLSKYGPGRSRPGWAERIGKKYQWIAMYQLASRLHDHVEPKQDRWKPEPLRTPLILLEERKHDPTLPLKITERELHASNWWIAESADLDSSKMLTDEEWVRRQEDIPALEKLLSVVEHDGQDWRLLVSYPSWGHLDADAGLDKQYRQVWMHIEGYLVQKNDLYTAYKSLQRRNLFGKWMPEGATWFYGFAGEYPWATPFNIEPEEWHSRGGTTNDFPLNYQPSWNELVIGQKYDASLPRDIQIVVPARTFFSSSDLWWNGQDGYCLVNGKTVFRDPSVVEAGPGSLLVDANDLMERLDKLGLRLIWTLLGEKRILGGAYSSPTPQRTFSQVAYLSEDGSLQIGERVFFEDYDKDTGPRVIKADGTARGSNIKKQ